MEETLASIQTWMAAYGIRLIGAILLFIIGKWVARLISNVSRKTLGARNIDPTLVGFIGNAVYILLMVIVIIASLNLIGVQTASFVAIIGAAGLAIGLALQGSLSNFAAGVLLIIFRPFKVGDFVEAAGTAGIIEEISIFTTQLRTGDNKAVIIPNSNITGGNIINYSAKDTRRVDMVFGVGYGDDLDKARKIIEEVVAADDRVLDEPAVTVGIIELGDSSVNFAVRPWVKTSDYWPTLFALNEAMKKRFDAEGISIPFPQRDVHLFKEE